MTTILVARTPSFIYLLSDRRLVDARTGTPDLHSNATKTVLFHRVLVFGYTGPASLPTKEGGWLPTNEWIGEAIKDSPDADTALHTLHERLKRCFERFAGRLHADARALCVAGGGWAQDEDGSVFPIPFTISNMQRDSPSEFTLQIGGAPHDPGPLEYETYGVRFDQPAAVELKRQLRRALARNATAPLTVLTLLVSAFRSFAERQRWVSVELLATMLPRPPTETNTYAIVGGGPNPTIPTALFVPAHAPIGRAQQFFPTTVLPGMYVASMEVSYGRTEPSNDP